MDPQAGYPPFAVTVDLVVLTVRTEQLSVLLIRRGIPPHRGAWALPGGFVRTDETLAGAAARELAEETGLTGPVGHLEQLATYGDPGRDPRGRVVTVAHLALLPDLPTPVAGTDAASAEWQPVDRVRTDRLAFDHARILADGVERARAKLEYTPLATAFCPPEFTVAQLRTVYETVWGTRLDPRNFHRKVTGTPGFVVPAGRATEGDRGRPAQLFRRGPATLLYPPMLRPTNP
ncbi:NUDIX domain-containing protein [Micromonospora sp. CPCC 206060]|uniref:NUDIX hydrolase n=1 Tax=Micromonospora sp. CPCC 206060 TaxID=3122406 RepID=UPI002FF2E46D